MRQPRMLTDRPPARRRAFRLFGLALVLLTLALALPAGAAAARPTITSFTPQRGPVGTLVTVTGSGFTGARSVLLGWVEADFTVQSDESIVLTVPAGARRGLIIVTTPEGQGGSAGFFDVTVAPGSITVTAPTGTGSYAQGSSLDVSWTTSSPVHDGEFALGVLSPAGGWNIGKLVPYEPLVRYYLEDLTLDVPPGSGYMVMVAWRPDVGSGPWGAYALSPGSFAVTDNRAITAFSFQGLTPPVSGVINQAAHTIALTVPAATDLHALVATFTTTGESVTVGPWTQFSGVTANDFSSPVTYKVTAADASTQNYTVTVVGPLLKIGVTAPTGTGSYAQGSSLTVSWTVSSAVAEGEFALGVRSPTGGWQIGKLVPASGAASYAAGLTLDVHPGSGYKVMVAWRPVVGSGSWSAYATSPGSFAVYVGDLKAITAFSFEGLTPPVSGVIDGAAHTIALTVPAATDLHALVATFTTTGESVTVGPWTQFSGVTANDFSSPVTYKVTAFDGSSQDYVVTVTVAGSLAIGNAYGGGVVAYILQSGDPGYSATEQHGLIAATADQTAYEGHGIQWAREPYWSISVPGTDTELGTGSANTTKIIAQNGTGTTYAAGLARDYNGGGYTDWYLPSQDELNKLYINRVAVGGFHTASGDWFFYWDSSESGPGGAWYQRFDGGYRGSEVKYDAFRVRAVRAF